MFTAALFTAARTWKETTGTTTDEWKRSCGKYIQWKLLSHKKEHLESILMTWRI